VSKEAWGRWGTDDEIGALNLIGAPQRLAATALVTEGRVISLAQPLDRRTPVPSHRLGFGHFFDRDGGDYAVGARRPGGFQFSEDTVVLATHTGTHIDALCHAWYDDLLYNGHNAGGIRSNGAAQCGIDKLPPIVTRGVLVDLSGNDGPPPAPGDRITAAGLRRSCAEQGVRPGPGDVVLIRTRWCERVAELGPAYFDGEPGLDVSAGEWLAESGVAAIGADNYAIEAIPFEDNTVFPLHQRLIRDFGVHLIEGLLLGELAASGRREFLFCAAALPITGGAGSPIHPFAML
jgi:kynurenine formamidase